MFWLIASLFFADPTPLDMPRAEAFLVREDGALRLEDRYDRLDLWISQSVIGRWTDSDGRTFVLASLAHEPPAVEEHGTVTRTDFAAQKIPMKRIRANGKFPVPFRRAIALLAPCALLGEEPRHARQLPHGYRNVDYWQHPTNYASIVCSFRLEKSERWYLAFWQLAEGDDYVERMQAFEDQFLRREFRDFLAVHPPSPIPHPSSLIPRPFSSERELLRADARHAVAAYPNWHVTDSVEFSVLDDLSVRDFVGTLTNEFATMRRKYAAALPTRIDGTNVLCVARIYASREEYLDALEADGHTNMVWTAAYWSPQRRELVACLSESGAHELLQTIRHEAFHQYLSYATSMIPTSPWLNEGYAQYFEEPDGGAWGDGFDMSDESIDRLAAILPGIFNMDYEQFYEGDDTERRLKYKLAWSVAFFLEKGADEVRFRPFEHFKSRYVESLLEHQDMRRASSAAFGSKDAFKLFVAEWKKFWKKR